MNILDRITRAPDGLDGAASATNTAVAETPPAVETPAPEVAPEAPLQVDTSLEVPKSPRTALERAFEQSDKRHRNERGQFTPTKDTPTDPKAAKPAPEAKPNGEAKPDAATADISQNGGAPTRLSEAARAAWATVPLPVRADVSRVIGELETGLKKHREGSEAYEKLRPYADLAAQHNTTVKDTLDSYLRISRGLNDQNPQARLKMVEHVAQIAGFSLRELAAAVMGQPLDRVASQQESTIRELRGEIKGLRDEFGGLKTNFEKQGQAEIEAKVQTFIDAKDATGNVLHPRFEELAKDIEQQLGMGYDLDTAYKRAELLNPAPQPAKPDMASEAAPHVEQIDKGKLSPSGAPGAGSNPNAKAVPKSAREALERAFAGVSIGH